MFLTPMTLHGITQLRNPSERVPLAESVPYRDALTLIEEGEFEGYENQTSASGPLRLQIFWSEGDLSKAAVVDVQEARPSMALVFSCSKCLSSDHSSQTCEHQWGSFILMWQALVAEDENFENQNLSKLSAELKKIKSSSENIEDVEDPRLRSYSNVALDSISLYLDEQPLLRGPSLASLLNADLSKYKFHEVQKDEELLSPRLWNLPEIFRRKSRAYSEQYFNEVNKQNRLTDILRYNFSNGMQISAREILRHPLHRKVPLDLLPQAKQPTSVFVQWPLIQQNDPSFVSQTLIELEEIMQSLLSQVTGFHRRKKIDLYLQNKNNPTQALRLTSIDFDPVNEVDWRVDFVERKDLETEFALMNFRKLPMYFFESFAIEGTEGVLLVHPWLREFSLLQEVLSGLSEDLFLADREMPRINVTGEIATKTILRYLRTRKIPVSVVGETRKLEAHQSLTEVRMQDSGDFYIQHDARVHGQKNLMRKGWTTKSTLYLQALSQGISFLFKAEAKDMASRTLTKRDWDLKLLKHLGILQYLFLETLSFHFEGQLLDGTVVLKNQIFESLHSKIRTLLVAGPGGTFVRDMTLSELCSKGVLDSFEDFVSLALKTMKDSESFYSEKGEVILEGVVEREFRLIFELLRSMALQSGGEAFKKSRTPFLSKIAKGDPEKDPTLHETLFHFPIEGADVNLLHSSLESLQKLIPFGFKIFYNDQPLQELQEDEFHVDFVLQTDTQEKYFNWFELNPKFFLRGLEVDPDNFLSLGGGGVIEYEGKLFLVPQKQMPSLKRLENFWIKLQKGKVESTRKKGDDKIYQLPRSQTLELLALRASGVKIQGDAEWKKLCEFYDNLGSQSRELRLPDSMKAHLKPYQAIGVQWLQDLYQLRLGALLADDMGLGKTLQTLCFLDDLRNKEELGQVLIVVPSSLVFNWQNEVEKFTPLLPLTVFSNKDRDAIGRRLEAKESMILIATYGLLMEHEQFLNQYKWKVLIFDEAQNLKNISTKRTSAARSLTAQFKIGLTGTPMENHYGEFYSLVDILVPGSLGKADEFRRQFVQTEMVTREEIQDLKLKIKPLLLRRTKKEILDQLPDKQETKVSIAFEDRQREIYRDIALAYNQRVKEAMADSQGEASVQLQMLTALLRLRQACSDPAALPNIRYEKVPPKLETLMDSLKEIVESGESALVFTQFLQTLEHTADLLKNAGIPVYVLHGGVPTKQRQKILADFTHSKAGSVLVMTLKTGGVGLNLTKASYVFHLEPWWNPSVENQATDRAHRLGQSKAVQVFRYIMHESLEEKIELLKERKDRKFHSLFSATEKDVEIGAGSAALTKQDFDILLGVE